MGFFESAQEIVARPDHNDTVDSRDACGVGPGVGIGAIHLYAVLIKRRRNMRRKKSAIHASSINSAMSCLNR